MPPLSRFPRERGRGRGMKGEGTKRRNAKVYTTRLSRKRSGVSGKAFFHDLYFSFTHLISAL